MNILITGVKGQLGSEIRYLSDGYNHNLFFKDSNSLDITNSDIVANYIRKNEIEAVINCAAYTAVDNAEDDENKAYNVNVIGVRNLLHAIGEVKGKLIHISTDYVFDGQNTIPYTEESEVNPLGVYGKTKREGELLVLNSELEAIVIRTSWLYSSYGNNFLKTMLRLGATKSSLNVVNDQIGTPTYARDLAKVCLDILSEEKKIDCKSKMYHFSNEGVSSWYDFAETIMEFAELDCKVSPIMTKDYPTKAKRPLYTVLDKNNIKSDFNISISNWRDSLRSCMDIIKK